MSIEAVQSDSGSSSPAPQESGLYNITSDSSFAPVGLSNTPLNLDLNDLFGDDELVELTTYAVEGADSKKRDSTKAQLSAAPLTVSRRKKKPKGFPKRPLSGYNIFFKQERVTVLEEHSAEIDAIGDDLDAAGSFNLSNVSFQDLGKIIGKRWKALSEEERKKYEGLAHQDSLRYRSEMETFNENKRKHKEEKILGVTASIREGKEFQPSKWGPSVISGVPEIKPLYPPSNHPFQARLPDRKDPPQPSLPHPSDWHHAPHQNHHYHHLPGSVASPDAGFNYAIPPGTELYLPDPQGRERKFRVHYKFYSMTRQAAESYMEHLSTCAVSTPYGFTDYPPPPAPGSNGNGRYVACKALTSRKGSYSNKSFSLANRRDSHYPFWS
jgi:HMG (high mobility group) box